MKYKLENCNICFGDATKYAWTELKRDSPEFFDRYGILPIYIKNGVVDEAVADRIYELEAEYTKEQLKPCIIFNKDVLTPIYVCEDCLKKAMRDLDDCKRANRRFNQN